MTLPIDKAGADVYTDFAGLTALKRSVRNNDPEAVRQVAKQYESLFARMMIKSMRDAVGKDPLFGSDQEQSYQEMYDDQLSIELREFCSMVIQHAQRSAMRWQKRERLLIRTRGVTEILVRPGLQHVFEFGTRS